MLTLVLTLPADAAGRRVKHGSRAHSTKKITKPSSRKIAKSKRGKQKYLAARSSRGRGLRTASRSRRVVARTQSTPKVARNAGGSRYLWSAPWFDKTPYPVTTSATIRQQFAQGSSSKYSPQQLVRAGVFKFQPLCGGIFQRQGSIKHIILHSTETESPADARRVILSWNNRGRSHPGAQYIVDRNGIIYQTVDPAYGTVHVNVNRTRFGVTNDNSVGIEIVRAGKQKYTRPQMESVACLVTYLQGRYEIGRSRVLAHGYVQPSTRRDPVNFNWTAFNQDLAFLSTGQSIASVPDTTITPVNLAAAQLNPVTLPAGRFAMMFNGNGLKINPFSFNIGMLFDGAKQATSKASSLRISQRSNAQVMHSDG
jgi:Negative regulator of beta-lactamase expression